MAMIISWFIIFQTRDSLATYMLSVVNLGNGDDNKLEVERDIDKSKIIAGNGDDTVTVHNWVRADATIDLRCWR